MARKKVKLELISGESARKATFKKRKKGLMKKVSELSTLCDVKACMIVYGPDEPSADVWPSLPEAVRVLRRLKRLPEMEQSKKMMNQEAFVRHQMGKLQEQLRRQDKENRELQTSLLMYQCLYRRSLDDVQIEDVTTLAWLVEMKLSKLRQLRGNLPPHPPPHPPPAAAVVQSSEAAPSSGDAAGRKKKAGSMPPPQGGEKGKAPMDDAAVCRDHHRHGWFAGGVDDGQLLLSRSRGGVVNPNIRNREWKDGCHSRN